MAKAKKGDTVKVHYTAKLEDGTVVNSTTNQEPWKFQIGKGQVIRGFEEGVVGMNPGESKTVPIPAEKAYGPLLEGMILKIDRSRLPDNLTPEVGQQFQIPLMGGKTVPVTVKEVSQSKILIDANHPLAGKDLVFDIKLVEIIQPSQ